MTPQIARRNSRQRISSESAWPLRRADGTKLYERPLAEREQKEQAE
jgi:hypothetical protein